MVEFSLDYIKKNKKNPLYDNLFRAELIAVSHTYAQIKNCIEKAWRLKNKQGLV